MMTSSQFVATKSELTVRRPRNRREDRQRKKSGQHGAASARVPSAGHTRQCGERAVPGRHLLHGFEVHGHESPAAEGRQAKQQAAGRNLPPAGVPVLAVSTPIPELPSTPTRCLLSKLMISSSGLFGNRGCRDGTAAHRFPTSPAMCLRSSNFLAAIDHSCLPQRSRQPVHLARLPINHLHRLGVVPLA